MTKLWYATPAVHWDHALPLGNGSMGAMCFGDTTFDRFSLNDDTVWSGGPMDRINPDARHALPTVRRLLHEGRLYEAQELTEETLMATPEGQRCHEPLADFCPLMERCTLTLPTDKALLALPYDKRLERVRSGESDLGLVADMFTMGRYLMATGSRPGSMPLNLQGIWNPSYRPPWDSKYNINAEMNYWPAESCHLSEMHLPLFAHMQRMLPQGQRVAQEMYGTRGWVAHHNTDVWGDCTPADSSLSSTVWQMGAAWLSLHIMEHYRFTMDEGFLAEYYPSWRRPPCSS